MFHISNNAIVIRIHVEEKNRTNELLATFISIGIFFVVVVRSNVVMACRIGKLLLWYVNRIASGYNTHSYCHYVYVFVHAKVHFVRIMTTHFVQPIAAHPTTQTPPCRHIHTDLTITYCVRTESCLVSIFDVMILFSDENVINVDRNKQKFELEKILDRESGSG